MSLHPDSISSRNASRHAASCGESTSTPSTSNIAPRNSACMRSSSRQWIPIAGLTAQWERAPVPAAQLANFVADADPDGPAEALTVSNHRELAALECHSDRRPAELHRERKSLQPVGELGIEVEDPVADTRCR